MNRRYLLVAGDNNEGGSSRALTVRFPPRTFERMAVAAAARQQHLGEFVVESVEARLDSLRDDVRETVAALFDEPMVSGGQVSETSRAAMGRTVRTARTKPRN